jgi:hypothetical protein
MKIKSLLLGSAAVLVAVSGARAADAIVVEPEPVEYVRVCDAYGSGWFYIPGTETCLKIDGDVRVQYTGFHYHEDRADETSAHRAAYRGRVNFRANNETEYGPLSSRIRLVGSGSAGTGTGTEAGKNGHNDQISVAEGPNTSDATVFVDWAVISLAGFRVGYGDSYWTTAANYGFYQARFDGVYQYDSALFLDYTYAANGFTATIGMQDGNRSGEAGSPDVYGGLTYTSGGLYLAGIYIYDGSEEAGAWRVRADYDFGNGWKFGGGYLSDNGDTDYVKGHAWFVTGQWQMTETMLLFAGYGNYDDQYDLDGAEGGQDYTTVGIAWDVVPGLLIQPEYNWVAYDESDTSSESENFGRFSLRIVRSF